VRNKLRIKGKGLINKGEKTTGDQIVTFEISLPKVHSSEAKNALLPNNF